MTITDIQKSLAAALEDHGDIEVMVNTATFPESENGTVFEIESLKMEKVQGVDDGGPVGKKYPMLIIKGAVDWHEHGDPL